MYEVERKYIVRRRDFATIQAKLFKRLVPAVPVHQCDHYLITDDASVTLRVRCQRSYDKVVYLRTEKRKCKLADNTNHECEIEISGEEFEQLVGKHQATWQDVELVVQKRRIEFRCHHLGHAVTICLDCVRGPDGMRLGHMVELETMVQDQADVVRAQQVLAKLAEDILPHGSKREKRGYRTIMLDCLKQQHRATARRRRSSKKRSK